MGKSREAILARLRENQEQYLPGDLLSSGLGISRAAVWKQIRELRKDGYRINAVPNRGYRLEKEPDFLEAKKLEDSSIYYYHSVDSTNRVARRLADDGAPNYSTVVAEEQLEGRGRLGRSWFSPAASGIWLSIILRPQMLIPSQAAPVTLVTAAILANLINNHYNLPLKVKWPNDLLLKDKKVGGILTELKGELDKIEYLIVGIGLNINQQQQDFPKGLRKVATSLHIESGEYFNRTDIIVAIRDNLVRAFNIFFNEGFAPFYMTWKKYNVTLGQKVTLSWKGGLLQGKAILLTREGALQIQDNRGEIYTVNYGELI